MPLLSSSTYLIVHNVQKVDINRSFFADFVTIKPVLTLNTDAP